MLVHAGLRTAYAPVAVPALAELQVRIVEVGLRRPNERSVHGRHAFHVRLERAPRRNRWPMAAHAVLWQEPRLAIDEGRVRAPEETRPAA
ncbi:MAG: hypothetical protein R2712_24105 [Vicinamibacterales bacterium]